MIMSKFSNLRILNTIKMINIKMRNYSETLGNKYNALFCLSTFRQKGFMKKINECDSENPSKCICDDKDGDLFSFQRNRLDRLAIYYQDNNKNALAKSLCFSFEDAGQNKVILWKKISKLLYLFLL